MTPKKVLLIELNEITWTLIDPMIERGELPTFARLKNEGAWAAPMSVDLPPQLDPWITWTTVYTGRRQSDHNVFFLQQPPETIRAKRLWELCAEQGLSVGVYGSLCSWPARPVKGFYVPDTFAPDPQTHPASLQPIQELNLTYTRSVRLPNDNDGAFFKAKLGARLVKLGLRPRTMARVARQLARERVAPHERWRRVALQPAVNFDFFRRLYRRHRPAFATFHSNHVAHYMHTYWKAMQPELFPQPATPEEVRHYGGAIRHGYRTADALLRGVLRLLDRDTVLVVASSMGQQPYVSRLKRGKYIAQLRSLDRLLDILGVQGRARALSTMSDQFNIYPDTAQTLQAVSRRLAAAYIDTPERPMFNLQALDNSLTVTLRHYDEVYEDSRCHFPHRGPQGAYRFEDLVYSTGLVKSGYHHPQGVLLLYGPGIRRGAHVAACDNLDLAPTLLTLLGLPVPTEMTGRVLLDECAA
ncbi:MAG TPA: alkaline phosphatase family protein [Pyrinomonadaceae bacterium]|jgi:hypothetical protein